MRLRFLGAAQEITGSMIVLELASGSILIDCGMFQGRRVESRERNRTLPVQASAASVAILTHSHIDHSGNLPTLVNSGFTGAIYTSSASRDLCDYMLRDSARIQKADAAYLNRKFADDPEFEPVEPLYDEEAVERALTQMVTVSYHQPFEPLSGVTARLFNSGHILGSAEIVLDVEERGQRRRLVFSGDLGRKGLPIIRDPEMPPTPVDYLVMESTYGDRIHDGVERMSDDLESVIADTMRRGGKVVVPAFAVGRTQELIYALHQLVSAGRLPRIPVYIDSPLAINVTEVFRRHPECFDAQTQVFLAAHGEVFGFEGATFVGSTEESIRLNDLKGPAVIIAASGMAEGGRILHHLRNTVEDPRNTILIVGFMAQHTLGRRLVERRPKVKIWGVERELHAKVVVLNSFSAHADRNDLIDFADACAAKRRVFLVHGEPGPQQSLQQAMQQCGHRVHCPARGEVIELD